MMRYELDEYASDVIEAVCEHLDGDMQAEALVYLAQTTKCPAMYALATNRLADMGRCIHCGCKLEPSTYKEWHTELDPPCTETVTEMYCPNCDM